MHEVLPSPLEREDAKGRRVRSLGRHVKFADRPEAAAADLTLL
jgi:hypothetical protein